MRHLCTMLACLLLASCAAQKSPPPAPAAPTATNQPAPHSAAATATRPPATLTPDAGRPAPTPTSVAGPGAPPASPTAPGPLPAGGGCGTATVTGTEALSVRSTPDQDGPLVGSVARGQQVTLRCTPPLIADQRTWREVESDAGAGWMSTRYLDIQAAEPADWPAAADAGLSFAFADRSGELLITPNIGALTLFQPVSPIHALVGWRPGAGGPESLHLLDLEARTARKLPPGAGPELLHPEDGAVNSVALVSADPGAERLWLRDPQTGGEQIVYHRDPAVAQWLAGDLRPAAAADQAVTLRIDWMDSQRFILTIDPHPAAVNRGHIAYGAVLRVDTATRQAELLTPAGSLLAVLPDQTLLVRHGWIDGEIWQHPPTGGAALLTEAGAWTGGSVGASPDGRWVAWREFQPPPAGDWSQRLPHECCSDEPGAGPLSLALWDRATGAVRHYAAPAMRWYLQYRYAPLTWSADSRTLYLNHDDGHAIIGLRPDGSSSTAIELGDSWGFVRYAGPDGALYYAASTSQFGLDYQRWRPDGSSTFVVSNTNAELTAYGLAFSEADGLVTVTDALSGSSRQYELGAAISPQYGWPYPVTAYGPQWRGRLEWQGLLATYGQ